MDEGQWTYNAWGFYKGLWVVLDERGHPAAWTGSEHIAEDICKAMNEALGLSTNDLYIG